MLSALHRMPSLCFLFPLEQGRQAERVLLLCHQAALSHEISHTHVHHFRPANRVALSLDFSNPLLHLLHPLVLFVPQARFHDRRPRGLAGFSRRKDTVSNAVPSVLFFSSSSLFYQVARVSSSFFFSLPLLPPLRLSSPRCS